MKIQQTISLPYKERQRLVFTINNDLNLVRLRTLDMETDVKYEGITLLHVTTEVIT